MLTTSLFVAAVAVQMNAYVLCMWLIYRLSKTTSRKELAWCQERYKCLGMHEPYKHMNRYVVASYVGREADQRLRTRLVENV